MTRTNTRRKLQPRWKIQIKRLLKKKIEPDGIIFLKMWRMFLKIFSRHTYTHKKRAEGVREGGWTRTRDGRKLDSFVKTRKFGRGMVAGRNNIAESCEMKWNTPNVVVNAECRRRMPKKTETPRIAIASMRKWNSVQIGGFLNRSHDRIVFTEHFVGRQPSFQTNDVAKSPLDLFSSKWFKVDSHSSL